MCTKLQLKKLPSDTCSNVSAKYLYHIEIKKRKKEQAIVDARNLCDHKVADL